MKQHHVTTLIFVGSAAFAGGIGYLLHTHHVSTPLLCACVSFALYTASRTLDDIRTALRTTTHRCTAPDCTFRVQLTGSSASENRHWQETAAAHPTHGAS